MVMRTFRTGFVEKKCPKNPTTIVGECPVQFEEKLLIPDAFAMVEPFSIAEQSSPLVFIRLVMTLMWPERRR